MFSYKYKIVQEDINYGGHVGNERALLFFQFSRMAFFESLGFTELDLGDGVGVIQKNGYVEYNKELFLNDEIEIRITKVEIEKINFTCYYEIYNNAGEKVINGYTMLVCYDYAAKKIKRVPQGFKDKVEALAS
ncbi:thioesterase family protein [uncultured Fusobacterium sp.]|uniref:acyl-CoA thioesterase n=1 Tax=uncultured Fusobacterium sp. TaxID=159267 RepID=UPI0025CFCDC9|nr:thioesterase family protein [uncultured Fusobacterium sp.]